jgi:hypothetical protein
MRSRRAPSCARKTEIRRLGEERQQWSDAAKTRHFRGQEPRANLDSDGVHAPVVQIVAERVELARVIVLHRRGINNNVREVETAGRIETAATDERKSGRRTRQSQGNAISKWQQAARGQCEKGQWKKEWKPKSVSHHHQDALARQHLIALHRETRLQPHVNTGLESEFGGNGARSANRSEGTCSERCSATKDGWGHIVLCYRLVLSHLEKWLQRRRRGEREEERRACSEKLREHGSMRKLPRLGCVSAQQDGARGTETQISTECQPIGAEQGRISGQRQTRLMTHLARARCGPRAFRPSAAPGGGRSRGRGRCRRTRARCDERATKKGGTR